MPRKRGAYDSVRIATCRNVGKRINPIFQYEKSDGIARNIRVREKKTQMMVAERNRRSKIENLDRCRGQRRQSSPTSAYHVSQIHVRYELVIRQQRRLTLARETLGELLATRIVLDKVAVVVHVSVRRGRVPLKLGRIRAPVRRVHDVLVHREVIAPSVPEPVSQLATVCPPRRLGLLLRGQRKTRIAPFLWGRRERV